jgi:aerobic carbon-monoxide dehydrogenase medium subunit
VKPVNFDYARPRDVAGALTLIASETRSAKIMAGNQSLGPMLNLRLVQPDLVVDITGIEELRRFEERADAIVIGGCVTHADIEDGRVPDVTRGALPGVARGIAYRAVRNRGTIGGSLTHADPSADWLSLLAALGAKVVLRSAAGERTIAVEDYVLGALEADIRAGEILVAVKVPKLGRGARWGYYKSCRKTGEFAHAIGAILVDPAAASARVVIGAIDTAPIVVTDAAELFGGRIAADYKQRFDIRVADTLLMKAGIDDVAQRHIHVSVLKRAVLEAAA